jgi:hypothetical protein
MLYGLYDLSITWVYDLGIMQVYDLGSKSGE